MSGGTGTGDCSQSYPTGTSVTLTAAARAGDTFTGWSGHCTGSDTCTLTLSANRSATANFAAPTGPEAAAGRWSSSHTMPIIGLHLSLLPGGDALLWGHGGAAGAVHAVLVNEQGVPSVAQTVLLSQ